MSQITTILDNIQGYPQNTFYWNGDFIFTFPTLETVYILKLVCLQQWTITWILHVVNVKNGTNVIYVNNYSCSTIMLYFIESIWEDYVRKKLKTDWQC